MSGSPWLVGPLVGPLAGPTGASTPVRRRLLCLPFAGGGSAMYEPLRRRLAGTALTVVRLPGRESRFREPALTDVDAVVDALAPVVRAWASAEPEAPWAVLGYSLGALIAYELVARLQATDAPMPALLAVAGADAPQVRRLAEPVSWLPDEQLVAVLHRLGGTSAEVLAVPELVAMVLPTIRADFRMLETYRPRPHPPLRCPVATYRALDDPEVQPDLVARWAELSAVATVHRTVPGSHFVITEQPDDLARLIDQDLDTYARAGRATG